METAHIINQPGHEVGDKALTLCGKKWKITSLWHELPDDNPICRPCVDTAVTGLTEITNQLDKVARYSLFAFDAATAPTLLGEIIVDQRAYAEKREAKAIAKAEKQQAAKIAKSVKKAEKKRNGDDRPPIAPDPDEPVADSEKNLIPEPVQEEPPPAKKTARKRTTKKAAKKAGDG